MNVTLRSGIFKALSALQVQHALRWYKARTNQITTLCFHRVSDEQDLSWPPLKISAFDQLMDYVSAHFEVIPLRRLRDHEPGSRPALILTFDDGYADFTDNALPILRKHRLPATHNVVVECVETGMQIWTQRVNNLFNQLFARRTATTLRVLGRAFEVRPQAAALLRQNLALCHFLLQQPAQARLAAVEELEGRLQVQPPRSAMMGWSDLRECLAIGVAIGSHTMTHDALPTIKEPQRRSLELLRSREVLSERLDVQVDALAFPNGEYNEEIVRESVAAGYKDLLTVESRCLRAEDIAPSYNLIPRILIGHSSVDEDIFNVENFHGTLRRLRQLRDLEPARHGPRRAWTLRRPPHRHAEQGGLAGARDSLPS